MNRLLDKTKTAALSIFIGFMIALLTCGGAVQLIAKFHQVKSRDCTHLMISLPLYTWPLSLQVAFIGSIALGICIATLTFWGLRDLRWSPRDRDLRSDDSAETLLKLGIVEYKVRTQQCNARTQQSNGRTQQYKRRTLESKSSTREGHPMQRLHSQVPKKGARIQSPHSGAQCKNKLALWAGKYAGQNFCVSEEDRGLVVGPPGTGKTAFLLNQILRATRGGLSFAAIDLKPELHKILASTLEDAGYRVLRVNPATPDLRLCPTAVGPRGHEPMRTKPMLCALRFRPAWSRTANTCRSRKP